MMRPFAEIVFWAAAALLVYAYAGYPLFLAAVAMFFPPRRAPEMSDEELPTVTLLITARNEAAGIGAKLEQSLALDYPADKLEILVVSDASTDSTDEIVRAAGDSRVRLLRMERRHGKTHGQNQGVVHARGEIVVFSDATNVYHPLALKYLAANYRNQEVAAVSGRYRYFNPGGESPTAAATAAFWNYETLLKTLQARLGTLTGCCGCIYSVRRDRYVPLVPAACSDLVEPLELVRRGFRVAFEPRALAFEETTESTRQEFRMRVRVIVGGMTGLLAVPELLRPWRRPWISLQLFSHKILRWSVGGLLVLLFAASLALARVPGYGWALAAQGAFYLLAGFGALLPVRRLPRFLALPLYFCTLNLAALVSAWQVARGRGGEHQTWTPVRRQA